MTPYLAGLVNDAIAELKIHGQDPACGRRGLGLRRRRPPRL